MDDKPLRMGQAWKVYDALTGDERVEFATEPSRIDVPFRELSSGRGASPKLWADAYLIAFATEVSGTVVTFDRALADRSSGILLA